MLTLVCNGTVVTPSKMIEDGGVLFADGVIQDIGRVADVRAAGFYQYPPPPVLDLCPRHGPSRYPG
jgi:cytosine/adenosine deaminase-related metal-dependent hydrolase